MILHFLPPRNGHILTQYYFRISITISTTAKLSEAIMHDDFFFGKFQDTKKILSPDIPHLHHHRRQWFFFSFTLPFCFACLFDSLKLNCIYFIFFCISVYLSMMAMILCLRGYVELNDNIKLVLYLFYTSFLISMFNRYCMRLNRT